MTTPHVTETRRAGHPTQPVTPRSAAVRLLRELQAVGAPDSVRRPVRRAVTAEEPLTERALYLARSWARLVDGPHMSNEEVDAIRRT